MKAFLIDPYAKYVEEVEYNEDGDYHQIYDFIKCGDSPFTCLTISELGDTLYLDDEGLFKDDQAFFVWKGYSQPLAGRALVLGTDEAGETRACQLTREDIIRNVLWDARDFY